MARRGHRNVLDEIHAALEANGLGDQTRLTVPHHPSRRDLKVFGVPADAEVGLRAIRELASVGRVSSWNQGRVGIRLTDQYIDEVGERLEAGDEEVITARDLRADEKIAVDFCDPNATKALHVGHLRNLALGNALAAAFRAAGAKVSTQSQVGDIGRSMGEAMAGFAKFGETRRRECPEEKGDHLVGHCYSRYVREVGDRGGDKSMLASDPALAREHMQRDDLANDLMESWQRSEPEALALWRKVRGLAMGGQEQTLQRLGISFDSLLFESDYIDAIEAVGDDLVACGIATRAPSGAVLYESGDEGYPYLVLRRPDGHSTQHLRYVALWHATRSGLSPGTSIEVMGDEWQPLAVYGERLLRSLDKGVVHPSACLLHGMVTLEGQVVKSSAAPWLIDEMLDRASAHPMLAKVAEVRPDWAERLNAAVALGICIGRPPGKRLEISERDLFDPARNPGWAMALVALKAWDPRYDGEPDPAATDRDYRFLVAQSQVHRQLVRRVCAEHNPLHLIHLHAHLSRWFLGTESSSRLSRAMRTISAVGLASLGLPALGERIGSTGVGARGTV